MFNNLFHRSRVVSLIDFDDYIISIDANGNIFFLNSPNFEILSTWRVVQSIYSSFKLSNNIIGLQTKDGNIMLFSLLSHSIIASFAIGSSFLKAIFLKSTNEILATSFSESSSTLSTFDCSNFQENRISNIDANCMIHCAVEYKHYLIIGKDDGLIEYIDLLNRPSYHILTNIKQSVFSMTIYDNFLYVGSADNVIYVFEIIIELSYIIALKNHAIIQSPIEGTSVISASKNFITAASWDGKLRVYDSQSLNTPREVFDLGNITDSILLKKINVNEYLLVCGLRNGHIFSTRVRINISTSFSNSVQIKQIS